MQTLISELTRLYLPAGAAVQQRQGDAAAGARLVTADGRTRAVVIAFRKQPGDAEGQHWRLLCDVANALQGELGLPAPAVSIDGDAAFGLWQSLATALPTAQVQQFLERLRAAYFPAMALDADAAAAPPALPPCPHARSGKWAAFIHPGLGASFADEAGLDMAPPSAGQAALLDGLHSISEAQFAQAMALLAPARGAAAGAPVPAQAGTPAPAPAAGLLLKDATLEDIVRHLHAQDIEPTFRHLLRKNE